MQARHASKVGEPYKVHLHAEVSAIVKCRNLKKAHKISVFRFNKQGQPMLAKPCPICISAIRATNITEIEWTSDE